MNIVLSIFEWPDGGKSAKLIDMHNEVDRIRFKKMSNHCLSTNGIVSTVGMNNLPEGGWIKLHEEFEKRGLDLKEFSIKPPMLPVTVKVPMLDKNFPVLGTISL